MALKLQNAAGGYESWEPGDAVTTARSKASEAENVAKRQGASRASKKDAKDKKAAATKAEKAALGAGTPAAGSEFFLRLYDNLDVQTVDVAAAKAALEAVRKRAEGWRTGVATSTALIFAVLSVKDEGIAKFENGSLLLLIVVALVTLAVAMASLFKMLRAANGPSWLDSRISDLNKPYDAKRYLIRAAAAAHDLELGQRFWFGSVCGFTLLVILSWTLPT